MTLGSTPYCPGSTTLIRPNPPGLALVTPPAAEPLTLTEARAQVRAGSDDTSEDTLLAAYVAGARHLVEQITGRALLTQTWEMSCDRFPSSSSIWLDLPKPPLQSVTSVKYLDTAGVQQTWDSSLYRVDTRAQLGRIAPAFGQYYPPIRSVTEAVLVKFVAGYGEDPSEVPEAIRMAVRLLVGHWFLSREEVAAGSSQRIPMGVSALLAPYKVRW